ncbi:hypothetical protein MAHJHV58_39580 [Mycobacterium avium subsp. hominissuis]
MGFRVDSPLTYQPVSWGHSLTDRDPDPVNLRAVGSPVFAPASLTLGSRCAVRLQRHFRPYQAR